ncbi:MAG: HAD family phosphatase [Anaerolineae bacterium]|nr:HAD family phosphatase [Anaerolineae bacterium]
MSTDPKGQLSVEPSRPALDPIHRALALDLDGTLLDSMQFHAGAWKQAFAELGLDAPLEWFLLWEGINGPGVVHLTLEKLNVARSPADRQRILDLKRAYYDQMFRPLPMPGLPLLYETLRQLRYPVAIVTGSENRVARRVLDVIGFTDVVQAVVGGDDIIHGKPGPDPYLKAAQALAALPQQCIALENAPAGIQSAVAAGLTCIAVATTLPEDRLAGAHRCLPDLETFAAWLSAEFERSGGIGGWHL